MVLLAFFHLFHSLLSKSGGIVGNGLIAGQGLLQGFYGGGFKGRHELPLRQSVFHI
jgi:hypothetical protein